MATSEEQDAANAINSFLEDAATFERALGGSSYRKATIQKVVEQWFIDGKEDESYVVNLIFFIENKRYQKTAINHLAYIKRYGFMHFRRNEPPKVDVQKSEPIRNPSIFYWSNDGGDDQFLGESKSPLHFLFSIVVMMLIIVGVLGTCAKLTM